MRVQGGARKVSPRKRSGGDRRNPAPIKQTKGLRLTALRSDGDSRNPVPCLDGRWIRQSLSHAAHDSSLCTKEPWKSGVPICSLRKSAIFKPPLFAKGEEVPQAATRKGGEMKGGLSVSLFVSVRRNADILCNTLSGLLVSPRFNGNCFAWNKRNAYKGTSCSLPRVLTVNVSALPSKTHSIRIRDSRIFLRKNPPREGGGRNRRSALRKN